MTPILAIDVEPGDMLYAGPKPGATQYVGKVEVVWRDPKSVAVVVVMTYAGKRLSRSYHKDHQVYVIRGAK